MKLLGALFFSFLILTDASSQLTDIIKSVKTGRKGQKGDVTEKKKRLQFGEVDLQGKWSSEGRKVKRHALDIVFMSKGFHFVLGDQSLKDYGESTLTPPEVLNISMNNKDVIVSLSSGKTVKRSIFLDRYQILELRFALYELFFGKEVRIKIEKESLAAEIRKARALDRKSKNINLSSSRTNQERTQGAKRAKQSGLGNKASRKSTKSGQKKEKLKEKKKTPKELKALEVQKKAALKAAIAMARESRKKQIKKKANLLKQFRKERSRKKISDDKKKNDKMLSSRNKKARKRPAKKTKTDDRPSPAGDFAFRKTAPFTPEIEVPDSGKRKTRFFGGLSYRTQETSAQYLVGVKTSLAYLYADVALESEVIEAPKSGILGHFNYIFSLSFGRATDDSDYKIPVYRGMSVDMSYSLFGRYLDLGLGLDFDALYFVQLPVLGEGLKIVEVSGNLLKAFIYLRPDRHHKFWPSLKLSYSHGVLLDSSVSSLEPVWSNIKAEAVGKITQKFALKAGLQLSSLSGTGNLGALTGESTSIYLGLVYLP